jgi:tryptophan synthase alpha chain
MSRIEGRFRALRQTGRKALIPYVTAGDPRPDVTVRLMHGLVEAGADILELGVPFSDPIGDGPVIQLACERALKHRVGLRDVLRMVEEFRKTDRDTPIVLMGYMNPIEVMGHAAFAAAAKDAGVDGVLTVDMPPEEMGDLSQCLADAGLDPIFLVAPTTGEARMRLICDHARGFVYYVSLKGVTGSAALDIDAVSRRVDHLHEITGVPVGVGFGISNPEQAARMSQAADAVVVGSALVKQIEAQAENPDAAVQAVTALLRSMREAMDADAAQTV